MPVMVIDDGGFRLVPRHVEDMGDGERGDLPDALREQENIVAGIADLDFRIRSQDHRRMVSRIVRPAHRKAVQRVQPDELVEKEEAVRPFRVGAVEEFRCDPAAVGDFADGDQRKIRPEL